MLKYFAYLSEIRDPRTEYTVVSGAIHEYYRNIDTFLFWFIPGHWLPKSKLPDVFHIDSNTQVIEAVIYKSNGNGYLVLRNMGSREVSFRIHKYAHEFIEEVAQKCQRPDIYGKVKLK